MRDPAELEHLLERVRLASRPDGELNAAIACSLIFRDRRPAQRGDHGEFEHWNGYIWVPTGFLLAEFYTSDLNAAVRLVGRVLPGWWWRVGSCSVSHDATIGPDRSGPDADLLAQRQFDEGFHGDRRDGNPCLALLDCTLQGLIARRAYRAAAAEVAHG